MKGHVIRMEVVADQESCRVLCYTEPNCISLNFGPLDGGVYKCELNNATEENHVPSTLREKMNYIYLAMEVNFLRFELQSDSFGIVPLMSSCALH